MILKDDKFPSQQKMLSDKRLNLYGLLQNSFSKFLIKKNSKTQIPKNTITMNIVCYNNLGSCLKLHYLAIPYFQETNRLFYQDLARKLHLVSNPNLC